LSHLGIVFFTLDERENVCYSLSMNLNIFSGKSSNERQKPKESSKHLKVVTRAWKQIYQLYTNQTDHNISIVKAEIPQVVLYEFAEMFNIAHTLDSENITFKLLFNYHNIPNLLDAINGSELMKNLFERNTIHTWNSGNTDLTFEISATEIIKMQMEFRPELRSFLLEINYKTIKQILVQIPEAFKLLVLNSKFVGIK
jgi:hypothetical protein